MKKLLALLLVFTMILSGIVVFAEKPSNEEFNEETISLEGTGITDADVPQVTVVDDVYGSGITKEQVIPMLKSINIFYSSRDTYLKKVLNLVNTLEKKKNPVLLKKMMTFLQSQFDKAKEKETQMGQKLENILNYIKENKASFSEMEIQAIRKSVKPVLEKYATHQKVMALISKKIDQLKQKVEGDKLKDLMKQAEQLDKAGKYGQAAEIYMQILKEGLNKDKNIYAKAGDLLSKSEGKGVKIFVNGKRPDFDVKPTIKDGRTMVPLRKIAEALNAKVEWDPATQSAIFYKGARKVVVPIGKKEMSINGQKKVIDVPAAIEDNRTLVPASAVSQALNSTVNWDQDTQTVIIEDNSGTDKDQIDASGAAVAGVDVTQDLSEQDAINQLGN